MTQGSPTTSDRPKTMYDKIWENHLVYQEPGDDSAILYIDQLLCHEVTSPQAFEGLRLAGRRVRHPDRVMAVQDQIEEAYKYVLSKINLGATFPNVRRKDTYEIPPGAIRELIANAVVHRSYVNAEASPITVAIYDDRLEITSPGRLKRGVTVEKMLEGCSDCRNEALALALSYMNIIEDWGSGIPRIRQELKEAGLRDLVIQDWPNAVRTIIYRKGVKPVNVPVNVSVKSSQKILETLRQNPNMSTTELAEQIGISRRAVAKHVAVLQSFGVLRRIGPDKGGHWEVVDGRQ